MKKGLLLVSLFIFSALVLTACGGGNKLVCTNKVTQQSGYGSMEIEQKIAIGFTDDKVKDGEVTITVSLSDELYAAIKSEGDIDTQMKYITDQYESQFKQSLGEAFKSSKASYSGQKITIDVDLDATKSKAGTTREEVSKYFTNNGFSCN